MLLNGIEYTAGNCDILIYGIPFACWIPDSMTVEETLNHFEPMGCAFVLAHPFRFSRTVNIDEKNLKRFHAIEVNSSNFNPNTTKKSIDFAKNLNIPTVIASDSHGTNSIGLWYIETSEIRNMSDFVDVMKSGKWTHDGVRDGG